MKTEQQIKALIAQMTLEEKAALCTGASSWTTTPIERLGIPELVCSDGPHGVRRLPNVHEPGTQSLPATCFPTYSSMASTWNRALMEEVGKAMAEECIALKVDVLLGPGVNMKRTPLCGRNFEYYSEDPYLAGEMAVAMINGVQSKGVGTSIKHFAANNQEFERFTISAEVDERTLRTVIRQKRSGVDRQAVGGIDGGKVVALRPATQPTTKPAAATRERKQDRNHSLELALQPA
jgi:beta-glucosidase